MGILCARSCRRYYIHVYLFFYPTKPRSQSYLIIQFNFLLLKSKEQTTADARTYTRTAHTSLSKYQNVLIHTLLHIPKKQNPSRIVPQNTDQHFVLWPWCAISSSWMLLCFCAVLFLFFFFFFLLVESKLNGPVSNSTPSGKWLPS